MPKIQVYLADGYTIEIAGMDDVLFAPASSDEPKTTLITGIHFVGRDAPEGSYTATTDSGSGNLFVYSKSGLPVTNEILTADASDGFGVEKAKLTLKEGYVIQISGTILGATLTPAELYYCTQVL